MDLIVAVYENWGIGAGGTQPVALSADRKFFRQTTKGSAVVVGRKTVQDFPGQKPLPGRDNYLLTRGTEVPEGFIRCCSAEEAAQKTGGKAFVIGGGSVYREMLPLCDRAYVTKVGACPVSDTFFPNLDEDPRWECTQCIQSGEENGIAYGMYLYERK